MKKNILLVIFLLSVCSTSYQKTITFDNEAINAKYTNCGIRTHFEVTAPILNGVNVDRSWLGLSLSSSSLGYFNLVACKNNGQIKTVEQYFYNGSSIVNMDKNLNLIGLDLTDVNVNGNQMTCKFVRDNKHQNPAYLNENIDNLLVKISYGSLLDDSLINAATEYSRYSVIDFRNHVNCDEFPIEHSIEESTVIENENFKVDDSQTKFKRNSLANKEKVNEKLEFNKGDFTIDPTPGLFNKGD
ncbi:unnamed protein product, partial [Brachionus calyciflorus]